jgi:hypothetical protein
MVQQGRLGHGGAGGRPASQVSELPARCLSTGIARRCRCLVHALLSDNPIMSLSHVNHNPLRGALPALCCPHVRIGAGSGVLLPTGTGTTSPDSDACSGNYHDGAHSS